MLVSIIIPIYNTKTEDLIQCMESILRQTYETFEVLLVDDGSDVICAEALDSIAQMDERIHVLHKKNEGVSVARNYGVSQSKGDCILFVDGDDLLTPWLIESGVEVMNSQNADVVIGKILKTNQRIMENITRPLNPAVRIIETSVDKELFEAHILAKSNVEWQCDDIGWEYNFEGCWAHLLKRSVATTFQFIPGLQVGEDTVWAVSMIENEDCPRICIVDSPWYLYIQNSYSVMNKFNPRIIDQLTAPVSILTPMFENRNGLVYVAYIDWILIKLKQISNRYVLAQKINLTNSERKLIMKEVINTYPWKEVTKDRRVLALKVRIKLFLYRKGVMVKLYSILKMIKQKKIRRDDR